MQVKNATNYVLFQIRHSRPRYSLPVYYTVQCPALPQLLLVDSDQYILSNFHSSLRKFSHDGHLQKKHSGLSFPVQWHLAAKTCFSHSQHSEHISKRRPFLECFYSAHQICQAFSPDFLINVFTALLGFYYGTRDTICF